MGAVVAKVKSLKDANSVLPAPGPAVTAAGGKLPGAKGPPSAVKAESASSKWKKANRKIAMLNQMARVFKAPISCPGCKGKGYATFAPMHPVAPMHHTCSHAHTCSHTYTCSHASSYATYVDRMHGSKCTTCNGTGIHTPGPKVSVGCRYKKDFDTNGVFYWWVPSRIGQRAACDLLRVTCCFRIGSMARTKAWTNPATIAQVVALALHLFHHCSHVADFANRA